MKLRNSQFAVVDQGKLIDYCLNPGHPRGRHKARQFAENLGITQKNAELLRAALLQAAMYEETTPAEEDEYGQRYVLDFDMKGPSGEAVVRSGWIVLVGEDFPRLTTCYILRKLKSYGA